MKHYGGLVWYQQALGFSVLRVEKGSLQNEFKNCFLKEEWLSFFLRLKIYRVLDHVANLSLSFPPFLNTNKN